MRRRTHPGKAVGSVPVAAWLAAAGLSIAVACDDTPDRAPSGGASDEGAGEAPAPEEVAAVAEPASSAWPTGAPDLLASLEEVGDAQSCRRRIRAEVPVEVAEAFADLGYEQILDDVCAGLVAVRDRSVEGCDALSVSALRRGCRRRLAIVAGRPDACPGDRALPGREPVCLAWAARDPALCRAAMPDRQARCRAVLAGEPDACDRERGGDRGRCEAMVRRYAPALGDERRESAAEEVEPRFAVTAEVVRDDETVDTVEISRDVLDRGVHLAAEGCSHRLSLRNPLGELPRPASIGGFDGSVEAQLDVPPDVETPHAVPLGPTTAAVRVRVPGHGEATSISGATGEVRLTAWLPERGAEIAGGIEADLALVPGRVRVDGAFRTFVRDVDPLPDSCAE